MKQINIRDLWEREWNNAHQFFNSKGNNKTLSKLKDKWYKDFKAMLIELEITVTENLKEKSKTNKELDDFIKESKKVRKLK